MNGESGLTVYTYNVDFHESCHALYNAYGQI